MTKDDIQQTLLQGESLTMECKLAENNLPKSVWETYSAFANTIGGKILLGIEENKKEKDPLKRFVIKGVNNVQKILEDFWNTINSDKVSENILLDNDVEIVEMDGKNIICINIPQADWRVKPVYLNNNMFKCSYKRNNAGDYHCTEKDVKTMLRDANEEGNDGSLMEGFTMDDIDLDTLHGYRNAFRTLNQEHPWNNVDDKIFLMNFRGYVIDRRIRQEGLTAAGLMMFGKGLSISERFGNFRMDYIDMSNLIGNERYKYRLTYDGRWENNFFQFFTMVLPKLTLDMPRPFRLKDGVQRIDDTPQIAAVREAFTNAIIHCDFFSAAGILRIEKHDDKLVLRNPGTLLLPKERVYAGGSSKARNPRIQTMLRMIGFGENVGSGFPMIINAWKEVGWREPLLINDLVTEEVKLTLYVPQGSVQKGEQKAEGEQKGEQKSELNKKKNQQKTKQTEKITMKE
ncbi:MAG: putative DNA binding domain-containing protein, partial [Prevotella sp.]|nr:putative DNA binding domain-containing protein [Prevotella sp.]